MYCINCGNKLNENDKFCTSCGKKIDNSVNNMGTSNGLRTASIVLGVLSIIASVTVIFLSYGFIMSIVGFILAIVALKKGKNTLGIVLNSIGFCLSIIAGIILFVFIFRMAGIFDKYEYEIEDDYMSKFKDIIEKY